MHRGQFLFVVLAVPCFGFLPCEDDSCKQSDDAAASRVLLQHAQSSFGPTSENQPGAPWTEAEALVIMAKLQNIVTDNFRQFVGDARKLECYAEGPGSNATNLDQKKVPCSFYGWMGPSTRGIWPTWPLMLRLGFHDCMRYKDGTGGCDGCMNFERMFQRFFAPGIRSRPNHVGGHNANLAFIADILERIYTEPKFPPGTPILGQSPDWPHGLSMKESGKSRADLWAFATMVATHQGFVANNKKCLSNETYYNTLGAGAQSCHISLARPMKFKTGRVDCSQSIRPEQWQCAASCGPSEADKSIDPNCKEGWFSCTRYASCKTSECKGCDYCQPVVDGSHRPRSYESLKSEETPNPDFGSSQLADFFKREFNFSKREAVIIMGAHSFGHYNGEISGGYKYGWVHKQADVLNNVYYILQATLPGKHFEIGNRYGVEIPASSVGGVNGSLAETRLALNNQRLQLGGGIFQWSHEYLRCPYCFNGTNLDRHQNIWGPMKSRDRCQPTPGRCAPDRCCELCSKATKAVMVKEGLGKGDRVPFVYELEGLTAEEQQDFTSHTCLRWVGVHELQLSTDVALHKDIVTESGGWPVDKSGQRLGGNKRFMYAGKTLNNLKDDDDPLSMHEIVELYAKEQNTWANAFVQTVEKMLETGAEVSLHSTFDLDMDISCGLDSKRIWQCQKGEAASCFNYRCPYRFIPKPKLETIKCESTWEATGEALCSPQECCIDLNNVPSPEGFEQLGLGFCVGVRAYATSFKEEAIDIATCAAQCELETPCKFFSLRPGEYCRRYADHPAGCGGARGAQNLWVTYVRIRQAPVDYKYVERPPVAHEGRGVPGSMSPLVSVDACKKACDKEGACKSFTLCKAGRGRPACYMKDKLVTASDANSTNPWVVKFWRCTTWYKEKTP